MSLATSMKGLVEDIQVSTKDRHAFVKDMTKDVKELIARFDKELEEMAKDLRHFLANSEKARKEDFAAMMKDITARLNDIRKDTRELLKETSTDMGKAREYWLSLSGHRKPGLPKKEEEGKKE